MKLTQKTTDGLDAAERQNRNHLLDEDLGGFGLRIRQRWLAHVDLPVRYRTAHPKDDPGRVTALSPARARSAANDLHAKVRLGTDPAAEKSDHRTQMSIADALRNYLAHQRAHLKWRSYVEVERHLLKNCKALHNSPLAKATAARSPP